MKTITETQSGPTQLTTTTITAPGCFAAYFPFRTLL
jgi:hypothetical protein